MRALGLFVLFVASCGNPQQSRVDLREPDAASFPVVAEALAPRCATLDCHGQVGRNFRFHWSRGLRLAPNARPGEGDTTADEHRVTYRSLVAIEPFLIDEVVRKQRAPADLTFVRKARGTEDHKGGAQITAGSDLDRCLISWLAGAVDADACKRATPANP